ncbi:hypothetical protein HanHA300_Chr11g0414881 [Helianthus annuus]|nr:hypothetical protein HanHA300_Chr11g0414881 [Helianthus annuus]
MGRSLRFVVLTGNMLSGDIPDSLLINGASIDLSYNNFTWQGPNRPACKQNMYGLLFSDPRSLRCKRTSVYAIDD